jgi:hypothetical protein
MRDQRTRSLAPTRSPGQVPLSPAERSLRARLAAYAMHAQHDTRRTSANGRAAFLARFEREVDPDGRLDPEERGRRAEQARRAYFARLALAAAKARRAKRERRQGGDAA